MDLVFPAQYYTAALLERGVKTLIYAGENDWICNQVYLLSIIEVQLSQSCPPYRGGGT